MQVWRNITDKLRQAWYRRDKQKLLVVIVAGISMIAGIGLGVYRNWTPEEAVLVAPQVSLDQLEEVVQERVQAVITDFYPWVLEGPIQLVTVEPPTSVMPQPTDMKPDPEPETQLSFEHLIWPVQGEIATPFGWHRHPVYGDWRFNAGLEFSVTDDAVRTVLPGEVVAVNSNGLETELVIDHGSGWVSTYRSIRGIQVGPGELVKQNQNIAYPESTGLIFFGLTHEGEPVNPQAFLH
ncbi:MAG: peptidoglycan DD-metalloendopeptidase family protein [Limnochordia bacterium]|jgi:murein DD-endopeptidase MepM/ murein hydrolase activator NlpD|nr:peptidoglycan DD-metalloendopeptidase family protein [Limnochordia bacterium]